MSSGIACLLHAHDAHMIHANRSTVHFHTCARSFLPRLLRLAFQQLTPKDPRGTYTHPRLCELAEDMPKL